LPQDKVVTIFAEIHRRFLEWTKNSPTGEFKVIIPVNQGGISGKAKIVRTENITR
jgi:hypothetical protein